MKFYRLLLPLFMAGASLLFLLDVLEVKAQSDLITNGTFDSSIDGWIPTGTAAWNAGQRAILPEIGDAIAQEFNVVTTGVYTLSFWCGDAHDTRSANGEYSIRDAPGILATSTIACATPATKTFSLLLTAGTYTLTIQFNNASGSNDILLDNISLLYASAGNNINTGDIFNGDFYGRGGWNASIPGWYRADHGLPDYGSASIPFTISGQDWISQTIVLDSGTFSVTFDCRSYRSDYPFTLDVYLGDAYERVSCAVAGTPIDDLSHTVEFDSVDAGSHVIAFVLFGGNGISRGIYLDNIMAGDTSEPPDDDEGGWWGEIVSATTPPYYGCRITITDTQTITDGSPLTQTTEITHSYTVSANLLTNFSFERGTPAGPDAWAWTGNAAYFWLLGGPEAHTGIRSLRNYPTEVIQTVILPDTAVFQIGIYARCLSEIGCQADIVPVTWNGMVMAQASEITGAYAAYSDTFVVGTSVADVAINLSEAQNGDVRVDDIWMYPVDANGLPSCDPLFYPEPGEDDSGDSGVDCVMYPNAVQCLTVPIGGAGVVCYSCARPPDTSASSISFWIAWLACVIRNMFSCSLRVWLLVVGNWIAGVRVALLAYVYWSVGTTQGGANWIAGQVVPAIQGGGTTIIQSGTNFWDALVAVVNLLRDLIDGLTAVALSLIELIGGLIIAMSLFLARIIDLVISLASAIPGAFSAAPFEFTGDDLARGGGLQGFSEAKAFTAFLMMLSVIDSITPQLEMAMMLGLGVLSVVIIVWSVEWWSDVLNQF